MDIPGSAIPWTLLVRVLDIAGTALVPDYNSKTELRSFQSESLYGGWQNHFSGGWPDSYKNYQLWCKIRLIIRNYTIYFFIYKKAEVAYIKLFPVYAIVKHLARIHCPFTIFGF